MEEQQQDEEGFKLKAVSSRRIGGRRSTGGATTTREQHDEDEQQQQQEPLSLFVLSCEDEDEQNNNKDTTVVDTAKTYDATASAANNNENEGEDTGRPSRPMMIQVLSSPSEIDSNNSPSQRQPSTEEGEEDVTFNSDTKEDPISETTIEELVRPILLSSRGVVLHREEQQQQQHDALKRLEQYIIIIRQQKQKQKHQSSLLFDMKKSIASTIIQQLDNNDNVNDDDDDDEDSNNSNDHDHDVVDKILFDESFCGPFASLSAAIETIQKLSSTSTCSSDSGGGDGDDDNNEDHTNALAVSLGIIRKILLGGDDDSRRRRRRRDNSIAAELEQQQQQQQQRVELEEGVESESLLFECLNELCSSVDGYTPTTTTTTTTATTNAEAGAVVVILEPWIQRLILLPTLISNAWYNCHRHQDSNSNKNNMPPPPPPPWCTKQDRFHSKLVQYATEQTLIVLNNNNGKKERDDQHADGSVISSYLSQLIQRLILRRGSSEEVVRGLYNSYNNDCKLDINNHNHNHNNNDGDGGNGAGESMALPSQSPWYQLFQLIRNSLIPKHVAILCRDLILHDNSIKRRRNKMPSSLHPGGDQIDGGDDSDLHTSSWLELSCLPLLSPPPPSTLSFPSSQDIQDSFVELTVLSTSKNYGNNSTGNDGYSASLCYTVASLLSKIQNNNNSNFQDDDESSSSSNDSNSVEGRNALQQQLWIVAKVWSQSVFVQQADYSTQRRLSQFLEYGLCILRKQRQMNSKGTHNRVGQEEDVDVCSPLVTRILEGVTERLHSTIPGTRIDGMRVAVELGKYIGQEVHFDELKSIDDNYDKEGKGSNSSRAAATETTSTKMEERKEKRQGSDTLSMADDSSWDDDDEDNTYASDSDDDDDEEDLRETPSPLYLRDCLDLLRTPETEEKAWTKHEAALDELPKLVRCHPSDLPDVAAALTTHLLRMENKFSIDAFTDMIEQSLLSLTVEEPIIVGQALIFEIFEDGSLRDRLTALSTLIEAAQELSGYNNNNNNNNNKMMVQQDSNMAIESKPSPIRQGPTVHGKRRLVTDSQPETSLVPTSNTLSNNNDNKTRRWGHGRTSKSKDSRIIANNFVQIAPMWFYSLVGYFWKTKDKSNLWGGHIGATLLARFFLTLSIIAECCGGLHPSTQIMAKDLFDLVWGFRDAEIAEVRASVLCSIGTSLGLFRDETLLSVLYSPSNDGSGGGGLDESLAKYLSEKETLDPDDNCRKLANQIYGTVANSIKSIEM